MVQRGRNHRYLQLHSYTAGKYHFFPTLVSATPCSFQHKNSISLCSIAIASRR